METASPPIEISSGETLLLEQCKYEETKKLNELIEELKKFKLGEDIVKESYYSMDSAIRKIYGMDGDIRSSIEKFQKIGSSEYVKYKIAQEVVQELAKKKQSVESFLPIFGPVDQYIQTHPGKSFDREKKLVDQYFKIQEETNKLIDYYVDQVSNLEATAEQQEKELGVKDIDRYLKEAEQEKPKIQTLQKEAQEIYAKKGALCDSEGFYQHLGECWSDATQQVILNTDGLKETIQKYLINETIPLEMHDVPESVFVPIFYAAKSQRVYLWYLGQNISKMSKQKKWTGVYLQEVQKRFLRHYISEGKRRKIQDEVCSLEQPAEIAREQISAIAKQAVARASGKEGISSAILGKLGQLSSKKEYNNLKGLATLSLEEYKTTEGDYAGGSVDDVSILLNLFENKLLKDKFYYRLVISKPNQEIKKFLLYKSLMYNIYATPEVMLDLTSEPFHTDSTVFLSSLYENPDKELEPISAVLITMQIAKGGGGHEAAFYVCGGKEFFYEDNYGLIPFQWKALLKKLSELKKDIHAVEYINFKMEEKDEYLNTSFYPAIYIDSTKTYATYIENEYVEFSSNIFTKEIGKRKYTLRKQEEEKNRITTTFILIYPKDKSELSNLGYTFQYAARIKEKPDEYTEFINAIFSKDMDYIDSALTQGSVEKLKTLETKNNGSVILQAVLSNSEIILQKLLLFGFNVNNHQKSLNNNTALQVAVILNNESIVKTLLKSGADVNAVDDNFYTALHHSVNIKDENLNLSIIKLLVESGSDVNKKSVIGKTPFSLSVHLTNLPIVQYLFEKGGDINTSVDDESLLILAISNESNENSLAIFQFLVEKGLDPKKDPKKIGYLLIFAILTKKLDIVKYLVEMGADVNEQGEKSGKYPLFFAAKNNSIDIASYLCSKGADPTLMTKANPEKEIKAETAFDVASTPEMTLLLETCKKPPATKGGRKRSLKVRQTRRKR